MEPYDTWVYSTLAAFYDRSTQTLLSSMHARSTQVCTFALQSLATRLLAEDALMSSSASPASTHEGATRHSVAVAATGAPSDTDCARDEVVAMLRARAAAGRAHQHTHQHTHSHSHARSALLHVAAPKSFSLHTAARALRDVANSMRGPEDPLRARNVADVIAICTRRFKALQGDDARTALVQQYHLVLSALVDAQLDLANAVALHVAKSLADLQLITQHRWLTGVEAEASVADAHTRAIAARTQHVDPLLRGDSLTLRLLTGVLSGDGVLAARVFQHDIAPRYRSTLATAGAHVRAVVSMLHAWAAISPRNATGNNAEEKRAHAFDERGGIATPSALVLAETVSRAVRMTDAARRLLTARAQGEMENGELRASLRAAVADASTSNTTSTSPAPGPDQERLRDEVERARARWRELSAGVTDAWVEREQASIAASLQEAEQRVFDVYVGARASLRARHATILKAAADAVATARDERERAFQGWMEREGPRLREAQHALSRILNEAERYGTDTLQCVQVMDASVRAQAHARAHAIAAACADALAAPLQTWRELS